MHTKEYSEIRVLYRYCSMFSVCSWIMCIGQVQVLIHHADTVLPVGIETTLRATVVHSSSCTCNVYSNGIRSTGMLYQVLQYRVIVHGC